MAKGKVIERKAVMTKNTTYKFDKRLSIGDEVLIKETPLGRGRMAYVATNPKDPNILSRDVTRSMFEYAEEEKFVVYVKETIETYKEIVVTAKDRKEAQLKALAQAKNIDFTNEEAETSYSTNSEAMTVAEHKKTFPESKLLK